MQHVDEKRAEPASAYLLMIRPRFRSTMRPEDHSVRLRETRRYSLFQLVELVLYQLS